MARNGSGTYNRAVAPYVAGTTITAATVNSEMDDMAAALTQSLSRDGQSPPTANLPMGNFRITGLANAIASTDAAPLGQIVAKAGDIMTGALGFAVGTAALPGVFVSGDTNTGFFQAAAAPDTLSISVGGVEVGRYGAGGFMRLAAGTAAVPAYSFSGDTDTGIYSVGANVIGVTMAGAKGLEFSPNSIILDTYPGAPSGALFIRAGDASATNARESLLIAVNETSIPVSAIRQTIATDGSGNIELYATPAGSRASDRRVLRATIPGAGPIALVGPVNVDGKALQIQRGTEQATTSGTAIDFTGIPAGVRRITVMFDSVSANGSSLPQIQIGSGSILNIGYLGTGSSWLTTVGTSANSTGFLLTNSVTAADAMFGQAVLTNISGNKWSFAFTGAHTNTIRGLSGAGLVSLSGVLDRVRLTTVNGTDVFDAGAINIFWES